MTHPGPRASRFNPVDPLEGLSAAELRALRRRLRKKAGKRPGGHALRGWAALERRADLRARQAGRERCKAWERRKPKATRPPCLARTRSGAPCKAKCVWVKGEFKPRERCWLHGGASTGPRTDEGRARLREAMRARWARWRAGEGPRPGAKPRDGNPR